MLSSELAWTSLRHDSGRLPTTASVKNSKVPRLVVGRVELDLAGGPGRIEVFPAGLDLAVGLEELLELLDAQFLDEVVGRS